MSSTLNPKKLKELLTSLREAVKSLDDDNNNNPSPWSIQSAFSLLLVSELASRGIGVDIPPNISSNGSSSSSEWILSLLEVIRSTAGKVPIDDASGGSSGTFPSPMMAGLNAAGGMAASACSSCIAKCKESNVDDLLLLLPKEKSAVDSCEQTLQRCQEVNDGRFYTLLKLAFDVSKSTSDDEGTLEKKRTLQYQKRHELQQRLNAIAYSNYLYGASHFATDQPPMWKRCLDTALLLSDQHGASLNIGSINHRSYLNSLTILPLQNMIRIAKGNEKWKRAKELSLFVAVGYVGAVKERLDGMKDEVSGGDVVLTKGRGDGSKKIGQQSVHELIQIYFLDRTQSLVDLGQKSIESLLHSAEGALSECNPPTSMSTTDADANFESVLLYRYVQVQIQYLGEESTIWTEVQRQFRAMKNRLPDGNEGGISVGEKSTATVSIGAKKTKSTAVAAKPTPTTPEEMESQTRTKLYIEAWNEWRSGASNDDIDALSPLALRDAVIELSSLLPPADLHGDSSWFTTIDIVQDCYVSLKLQVNRLREIAISFQKQCNKKKTEKDMSQDVALAWGAVLSFVSPLITNHLDKIVARDGDADGVGDGVIVELRPMLESASEAIITASWMCEPIARKVQGKEFQLIPQLLPMVHNCLTVCKKERSREEEQSLEQAKKKSSVLSSHHRYSETEKKDMLLLECALSASRCRMELESAISNESPTNVSVNSLAVVARKATIAATSSVKTDVALKTSSLSSSSARAMFGSPFLQFISSWSGMYLSPWPFCTLGQARTILRSARESLSVANKAWGRQLMSRLEDVLLDIGEADLEGSLAGGVTADSRRLYKQALDSISLLNGEGTKLMEAHCLLGLARLSMASDVEDSAIAAEKYARNALEILGMMDISQTDTLICLHAWDNPLLQSFSHAYHVCSSRQLVAEACLRSSRPDDAYSFLQSAVNEAPGNFEAAFALASYYLRSMLVGCSDGEESDGKQNEARNQLLKAAKMNKTNADPFALLGVYYEAQGDDTRAKGCYQRALVIDASHPVAGRGLQRLLPLEEMQPFCEDAVKVNSPEIGWAWRMLGQLKSWKDGDDTSAVICFQQALRCRDVVQDPRTAALGIFYKDPKRSNADTLQNCEAGETWSELASCYRQLGKFSASLRAYDAAYSVSDGKLSPSALCACAQGTITMIVAYFAYKPFSK